ncbi:MAG: Crossover junction endodeoxyribonuclease RuvC [Microgenomates group bacterium GW2011_GWA1_46_7]|nr:MAG: Crossover junction endodeoxyribonuclease RuvC [Microgenomates group bacterium GW2011_GWA1_46_7]
MTRVLGIDPGTHRLGWAVIDGTKSKPHLLACDVLEFPQHTSSAEYLQKIHSFIDSLLLKYHPDKLGIEALFAQKNVKTAIQVAEARGVILFTFAARGYVWHELSPNTVKSAVAGAGNAGKAEVRRMVGLLLNLDTAQLLDDTTDALAVALAAQIL